MAVNPPPSEEFPPKGGTTSEVFLSDVRNSCNFQIPYNTFEYPEITIASYGDFAINLNAEYYILGIDLERFERVERVESEIKEAVLVEFAKNKIEIPYPVQEVILKK